jgi:hypothetical protein
MSAENIQPSQDNAMDTDITQKTSAVNQVASYKPGFFNSTNIVQLNKNYEDFLNFIHENKIDLVSRNCPRIHKDILRKYEIEMEKRENEFAEYKKIIDGTPSAKFLAPEVKEAFGQFGTEASDKFNTFVSCTREAFQIKSEENLKLGKEIQELKAEINRKRPSSNDRLGYGDEQIAKRTKVENEDGSSSIGIPQKTLRYDPLQGSNVKHQQDAVNSFLKQFVSTTGYYQEFINQNPNSEKYHQKIIDTEGSLNKPKGTVIEDLKF